MSASAGSPPSQSPTPSPAFPVLLLAAALSDVGPQLLLTFSEAMNTATSGLGNTSDASLACAAASPTLFAADTLSLLGAAAQCYWSSPTVLTIALPSVTAVPAGASVSVVGDVFVRATAQATSNTVPATTVVVQGRRPAPVVLNAAMTSSGAAVVLYFDPTASASSGSFGVGSAAVSGAVPCTAVFDNVDLGVGATCSWSTPYALTVQLGRASASTPLIAPVADVYSSPTAPSVSKCDDAVDGSTLALRAGVVTSVTGGVLATAPTCVRVLRPMNPSPPVVSVAGSTNLGLCDDLSLDGGGTVDLSGRVPALQWAITPLNAAANASGVVVNASAPLSAFATTSAVTVPQVQLAPGAVYAVTLTATTFMGATAASSVVITVVDKALPTAVIVGQPVARYPANRGVTVQAAGTTPSSLTCTVPQVPLTFNWTLIAAVPIPGACEAGYTAVVDNIAPVSK